MTQQSAQQRPERQRTRQLSGMQVMFAAILAIGLLLAINFSSRITASQPLQEAYDRVQAEIEALRREQAELIRQRDYVRSDAYVEKWARSEGKMVRPDEVLVIPLPESAAAAPEAAPAPEQAQVAVETRPPRPEPWVLWWGLFFDGPPPQIAGLPSASDR
jgi:cell division protein FtsB